MSIPMIGGSESDEIAMVQNDATYNSALEEAAKLLEVSAERIGGGRSHINQIDQHTMSVLFDKAKLIRALRH